MEEPESLKTVLASKVRSGFATMLVLTRKLEEGLFIGDEIYVQVVRLEGGQARLGIIAPRDIIVLRNELLMPSDPKVKWLRQQINKR